ncbi:hypothetical protein UFOVP326_17 [uncultured Caudovirales phage]|uniref:Uncharacterized protein n=1 Tax=uncultured Caudovirales phage TaxID=2100421 RepID=A0A6J5LZT2_9CAUD|nr:hypothetical protein UFOVP326_17 [uncultured Caudovirales phage]
MASGTGFQTDDAGGLWASQPPAQARNYAVDLSAELPAGHTIATATWAVAPAGLTVASAGTEGQTARVRVTGGTHGTWYSVTGTVTSSGGEVCITVFRLHVWDPAQLGAGVVSCFPNLAAAVSQLRRDRLVAVAAQYLPDLHLHDEYLLERLVSAEREATRQLGFFLTPREILPNGHPPAERAALEAEGKVVEVEPGYDLTPGFWSGTAWGELYLRHRPVLAIHGVRLAHPLPSSSTYNIPQEWMRWDRDKGVLNLVPNVSAIGIPLNAFALSIVGGGRSVPLMIQVRYRAGLENAARDHPDILSAIKALAVLETIEDKFIPASGSVSADGLSRSMSWDPDKFREGVETKLKGIRRSVLGVMMAVV